MGGHEEVLEGQPPPRATCRPTFVNDFTAQVVQLLHPLLMDPPVRLRGGTIRVCLVNLYLWPCLLRPCASHGQLLGVLRFV